MYLVKCPIYAQVVKWQLGLGRLGEDNKSKDEAMKDEPAVKKRKVDI